MPASCVTRVLKNVRHIRAVVPDAFPETEPPEGFGSVVPWDVLRRFHQMPESELAAYPKLAQAAKLLRQRPPVQGTGREPRGLIFEDSPFSGTLYLAQITFKVGAGRLLVSDADMAMMLQYTQAALPAISKYVAQYGGNTLRVSPTVLKMDVDVPNGRYNQGTLEGWVRSLLGLVTTPRNQSCILVFSPPGVVNTDCDPSKGDLGFHESVLTVQPTFPLTYVTTPYCFTNVRGSTLTLADRADAYADTLSHEIAEMVADPYVSWTNPEVCDACAGNCNNDWRSFFALDGGGGYAYLRSVKGYPPATYKYDFFTAAVTKNDHAGDCPAPEAACAYAPSAQQGVAELLFYEGADGYAELYSVDAHGNLALQTTHTDWRNSWSQIVPGVYTSKPAGSRKDLLFYDRAAGWGEFYQTGNAGDMHQFSVHSNWRTSWSQIIPGSFSQAGAMDLLFYEPSDGFGEYDHTDGKGNLTLIRNQPGWRGSWSIILPGRFSNSNLTDLLFYDPTAGVGEFYKMGPQGNMSLLQTHAGWRTSWSQIVPGKFSNGGYTDLLFYDPLSGTGEFYKTDGNGGISLLATITGWRTTWSMILPCKISAGPYTDLLFYDPTGGVGEFYSADGKGGMSMIQSHTDWRRSWTMIRSL